MSRLPRGVLITDEQAGYVAFARRAIIACWRDAGLEPPGLLPFLDAITQAAREGRTVLAASDVGSEVDEPISEVTRSTLTVPEAAERIGRTDRRVVQLLESGRLVGQKHGRGRGTWVIDEASVERLRSQRKHEDEEKPDGKDKPGRSDAGRCA